jgi:hypothetical protein
MGLRERASDYSKTTQAAHGIDLGLELRPDLNKRAPAAEPSPTVQPAKQPGLQQKAEAASVRALRDPISTPLLKLPLALATSHSSTPS